MISGMRLMNQNPDSQRPFRPFRRFPFYRQLDAMDCGPACLRMIAAHYGKHYSLQYLREACYIDREGVSLKGIGEAAERIGLRTLAVKVPFGGPKDSPCLLQDGYIFSDTIANNIAESDEFPRMDRIEHAVSVANIRDFTDALPLGYNTMIGARGNGLSQGQRQRLLIARAVYKDPEFLFFDEATNALDANNERVIMENLNRYFEGRTVIVVAHRLSTVKNADQIVVMDQGKIMEVGTHLDLVRRQGRYYTLVKNQLELGT